MDDRSEPTISEVTRRNIVDAVTVANFRWSGRLTEPEFLARLYNLNELPSHDHRHNTASGDIAQHRVWNLDGSDDWVFADSRFDLFDGSDETFLRFLCEMVHPAVRPDPDEVKWAIETVNRYLADDGWEIAACTEMSGKPVFAPRRRFEGASIVLNQAQRVADALSGNYITQQITRMQGALEKDPELAIGTAKEFVETICKTILGRCLVTLHGNEDLPELVQLTFRHFRLTPNDVSDGIRASRTIRGLLTNLATVAQNLAELRNYHGSGHGKDATVITLGVRYARLAVGAATSLGVFVFETYESGQKGI